MESIKKIYVATDSEEIEKNGVFYINTVKNIIEYQNRLSGNIAIYEMPSYTAIDIDEPDDWVVAENIMNKYVLNKNEI